MTEEAERGGQGAPHSRPTPGYFHFDLFYVFKGLRKILFGNGVLLLKQNESLVLYNYHFNAGY